MSKWKTSYLSTEVSSEFIYSGDNNINSLLAQSSTFSLPSKQKNHILSSLLITSSPSQLSRQMNSTKVNYILFNDSNKSYYLLILVVIILVIALMVILTFTFLFIIYARPAAFSCKKTLFSSPNEKPKENILVVNTTPISDSNRNSGSLNTPESSSNAATTSSKISKTDEENDDIDVKIQVSDDCSSSIEKSMHQSVNRLNDKDICKKNHPISITIQSFNKNNNNINNYDQGNNFNYGGSFSSLNSSSHGTDNKVFDSNNLIVDDRSS